jgi:hypothetical protein
MRRTDEQYTTIISAWAVGGAVGFAAVAALLLTSMNVVIFNFPVFQVAPAIAIDTITAGTLAGLIIGIYDARSRTRLQEAEYQRDRIEAFANRAADMNNYGRAVNQCSTTEEVSALCVEAVATLVDISETAFVERRGELATIIDKTIVGVSDETIAEMAMRASDTDPASVVRHTEDLPEELDDSVDSILTILVMENENTTVGIVALNRGDEVTDETQALLEMLVSHAGSALENIYRPGPQNEMDDQDEEVDIEVESGPEE